MTALLEVSGVSKTFGHARVLDDVSFEVRESETLAILGPSGSGKSTILKCIAQLVDIDAGRISLDGDPLGVRPDGRRLRPRALAEQRRHVGMVFQHFNLFGHLSAIENIMLAPRLVTHAAERDNRERAMQLLERVGLQEKANSYPRELSGGQQQRIAIARSLAMQPRLILFDEPTSALDAEMIREVLEFMTELALDGTTMVVVTHETGFARRVARNVMFMDHGAVLEHAPSERFFSAPSHPRAKEFLDRIIH